MPTLNLLHTSRDRELTTLYDALFLAPSALSFLKGRWSRCLSLQSSALPPGSHRMCLSPLPYHMTKLSHPITKPSS